MGGIPEAVHTLYEIQRCAVRMRFELEKGDVDAFAELLTRHWELSKRLDGGCMRYFKTAVWMYGSAALSEDLQCIREKRYKLRRDETCD